MCFFFSGESHDIAHHDVGMSQTFGSMNIHLHYASYVYVSISYLMYRAFDPSHMAIEYSKCKENSRSHIQAYLRQ